MASSRVIGLLLAALLLTAGYAAADEAAPEGLEDAEEAQAVGEEAPAPVVSEVIPEADPAELANGDGDLSTTGACADDLLHFCRSIKPGEGRLSACMTNERNEEDKGNVQGRKISTECAAEMRDFKVDRSMNINKDLKLAFSCKEDVEKYCNDSNIYPEPGAVLTCLREVKDRLTEKCQEEVTRTQIQSSKDFAVDAMLNELCTMDAEALCSDVTPGEGRVQYCLRSHRAQLSWDCQEELFRQEVENADDVRLSNVLLRKCMKDKKKYCGDVKPGNARVKDCLEDNRNEPEFSVECKDEFEKMMSRRASDFRLDAKLRELCKDDIEEVCGYEKDSLDSIAGYDGRVIECLQDYKEELTTQSCKRRVHKLTMRAAQDIRMDRPLSDACYEDRQKLCKDEQPGSARVIRCLQNNRLTLSYECRATLFDQEVRLSEDIDFQYPMKKACGNEIAQFCKGIQHGEGRVIQCLTDHDSEADMSSQCRSEVKRFETRTGEDYRLNHRLNKACDVEIDRLCPDVCSPFQGQACGGTVLQCLSDKAANITDTACKSEVFSTQRGWAGDYRRDAVLKKACSTDVEQFCTDTEKGEGRVHDCLRKNKAKLSQECAAQELKLNILQASDIRLRPGMQAQCSEEIAVYCKNVKPGKARVYKCLANNMGKVDFSNSCKARLEEKQSAQQSYYKLDFGVKEACGTEVDSLCKDKKGAGHGKAAVLKCFIAKYDQVKSNTCKKEVSRATRMALWQYRKGAALTLACDVDAASSCTDADPKELGSIGRCLAKVVAEDRPMSDACHMLINIAAPKDAKQMFDDEMTTAAVISKVEDIERAASLKQAFVQTDDKTGNSMVTVTGWVALASVTALVVCIVGAVLYAYRKFSGQDKPYTLVVKGGDV